MRRKQRSGPSPAVDTNRAGDAPWGVFIAGNSETALDNTFVPLRRAEARLPDLRSTDRYCDAVMPASEKKTARPQLEMLCRRASPEDVAPLLLIDRCRAAEECLDSFIDIAAGSSEIDPGRSTHNSEPTLASATNFDRDVAIRSAPPGGEDSFFSCG
jgi:hypothetical protein